MRFFFLWVYTVSLFFFLKCILLRITNQMSLSHWILDHVITYNTVFSICSQYYEFYKVFPRKVSDKPNCTFPPRGSTQVLCLFPGVLWLWHFLYWVGPHPVSSLIYTLSLCRGHSWRVRLAKQETLTPPGHLVVIPIGSYFKMSYLLEYWSDRSEIWNTYWIWSSLICRGPWMSTMVLYCWCHSDGASVLLYFTLLCHKIHTKSPDKYQNYNLMLSIVDCSSLCYIIFVLKTVFKQLITVC